jgi:2-phospho-L-lactate guanylyltransferase
MAPVPTAVAVPVKAFARAKMRLSPVLGPQERAALAARMAEAVLAAARPLPVYVVCDDPGVAAWAERNDARVLSTPGLGLNGAVDRALEVLEEMGYDRVVVAHGDLPLATQLAWLADVEGVVLVPDRRDDGTNVISLPTGCGFRFAYGPGSLARHREEAARTGLPWRVVHDDRLGWDVDLPADMLGGA